MIIALLIVATVVTLASDFLLPFRRTENFLHQQQAFNYLLATTQTQYFQLKAVTEFVGRQFYLTSVIKRAGNPANPDIKVIFRDQRRIDDY